MIWIQERPATPSNLPASGQTPRPPSEPLPDAARLAAWVEKLAVPRHLWRHPHDNAWVGAQIGSAFKSYGLDVQLQGQFRNIVALPSEPDERPLTLVTAHYDSVPFCPGADDNASAVAVMLECARLLSAIRPQPQVGFIAFNAEEDGMLGSADFVRNGLPLLKRKLRAVHVLEMVGFRGAPAEEQTLPLPLMPARYKTPDFVGLVGKGGGNASIARAVKAKAAPRLRLLGLKTWGPLHRLIPDLRRSDHFPFWMADLPAVMWTDTADFRNPNYHRRSDTPETLDYHFMRQVADVLLEVVTTEAAL